MTDLPPGNYSWILVGQYWPSGTTVTVTANAAQNRSAIQILFDDYVNVLRATRTGPLTTMRGVTADTTHSAFKDGETHSGEVVDRNGVKQKAFSDATNAMSGLRSDLAQIAADGNQSIDSILQSKNPDKLSKVVEVIAQKNREAAHKASQYGDKILAGIQDVLAAEGDPRTPQQFARDNGIDLSKPQQPSEDGIRAAVQPLIDQPTTTQQPSAAGDYGTPLSATSTKPSSPTPQQPSDAGDYGTPSSATSTKPSSPTPQQPTTEGGYGTGPSANPPRHLRIPPQAQAN